VGKAFVKKKIDLCPSVEKSSGEGFETSFVERKYVGPLGSSK
jgi:hypothetical protein